MAYHPRGVGRSRVVLRRSTSFDFTVLTEYSQFRQCYCNAKFFDVIYFSGTPVPVWQAVTRKEKVGFMSAIDTLISFIKTLTPEQADKIIRQMPRLIALTEEPSQPELHQVS